MINYKHPKHHNNQFDHPTPANFNILDRIREKENTKTEQEIDNEVNSLFWGLEPRDMLT